MPIKIPYITVSEMRKIDELMIKYFGISLGVMMENAGRNLAELALKFEKNNFAALVGIGNNGGGGLVAARHLMDRGKDVRIILANDYSAFKETPKKQYLILAKITKNIFIYNKKNKNTIKNMIKNSDLVLDCLLGYSLKGNPQGNEKELINLANESKKPIIALDAPSGLDLDSGIAHKPCIKAKATMTLALPKKGFLNRKSKKYVGDLYLAGISVPAKLYEEIGIDVDKNLFSKGAITKIN